MVALEPDILQLLHYTEVCVYIYIYVYTYIVKVLKEIETDREKNTVESKK